jgi:hypothetical protein
MDGFNQRPRLPSKPDQAIHPNFIGHAHRASHTEKRQYSSYKKPGANAPVIKVLKDKDQTSHYEAEAGYKRTNRYKETEALHPA